MDSKMVKERIQKTSKVLTILIKIAKVFCFVGIGFISAGILWVMFNGNLDILTIKGNVIIKSPFSSDFLKDANIKELLTILIVALIRTIMLVLVLKQAQMMFMDISQEGNPFQKKHIDHIRKIAVFFLVMVLVKVDTGNAIHDLEFSLDFTGIIAAGILWCVSIIFEYGCILQNESDETL